MMVIRPVVAEDLAGLMTLAGETGGGLTSLPADEKTLESALSGLSIRIGKNTDARNGIAEKGGELQKSEAGLTLMRSLSDTASGALSGKAKVQLETYVQMAFFDRIIARANLRLLKMSDGQYELIRRQEASSNASQSGRRISMNWGMGEILSNRPMANVSQMIQPLRERVLAIYCLSRVVAGTAAGGLAGSSPPFNHQ